VGLWVSGVSGIEASRFQRYKEIFIFLVVTIAHAHRLLKATSDPTRLRLLSLLASGEATVGELVDVLSQSQPRVSRHLKLLAEAGLVEHFRDGQWVYYRLAPAVRAAALLEQIIALAGAGDAAIESDAAKMAGIRRQRERYALTAPTGPRRWVEVHADRPDEGALRQALDESLGTVPLGDVLDIGTGSGLVLRLLGARARHAVGLDTSRAMRVLARTRLQEAGLARCTIRAGDMHVLPFPDMSFDVVVLDEALTLSHRRLHALEEAVRVLRPLGRLLVLDRILPAVRRLPAHPSQDALFENQLNTMLRGLGLKLAQRIWLPGRTLEYALFTATAVGKQRRTGTHD
jgi:ArsR family transcriptional regulator